MLGCALIGKGSEKEMADVTCMGVGAKKIEWSAFIPVPGFVGSDTMPAAHASPDQKEVNDGQTPTRAA